MIPCNTLPTLLRTRTCHTISTHYTKQGHTIPWNTLKHFLDTPYIYWCHTASTHYRQSRAQAILVCNRRTLLCVYVRNAQSSTQRTGLFDSHGIPCGPKTHQNQEHDTFCTLQTLHTKCTRPGIPFSIITFQFPGSDQSLTKKMIWGGRRGEGCKILKMESLTAFY